MLVCLSVFAYFIQLYTQKRFLNVTQCLLIFLSLYFLCLIPNFNNISPSVSLSSFFNSKRLNISAKSETYSSNCPPKSQIWAYLFSIRTYDLRKTDYQWTQRSKMSYWHSRTMQINVLQVVLLLKYIVSELINTSKIIFFIIKNALEIREKWAVSGQILLAE